MMVTDKTYSMEPRLVEKLDLMAERVTKHKFDNLLIVDGKEGYGKSNLASGVAYYVAWKTGRPFSIDNVFFLVDDMVKFATSTKEQIIWWDEAALGGLASESYTKIQRKLLKLLMVARKKQHFYVFVIPKFFKLKGDIIDRAIGLLHTYSRDEVTRGRFAYYLNESKDKLYDYWTKSRAKAYTQFYDFTGTFGESLPLIIDENEYDKRKDAAILSINDDGREISKEYVKLKNSYDALRIAYSTIPNTSQAFLSKHAHISIKTLGNWKRMANSKPMKEKEGNGNNKHMILNGVNPDGKVDEEDETDE